MQTANLRNVRPRALYYWARTYSQQLSRGQKSTYSKLRPTVCIFFLNYVELTEGPAELHSIFELRERTSGLPLSPHLQIHFVELPRLKEKPFRKSRPDEDVDLGLWSSFLLCRNEEKLEELSMAHPTLRQAKSALKAISTSKGNRAVAEARRKALLDDQSALLDARETALAKGLERGREEGREEGRSEGIMKGREATTEDVVVRLHRHGMKEQQISEMLDLDKAKVRQILSKAMKH